jgi:predicted TPR repeat methyltransferase
MKDKAASALQDVYTATNHHELSQAYAAWSAEYDRETAELGYCLPFLITAWVTRFVPVDAGPVLDAGCGTGLSGPYLRALGYDDLEGLDLSSAMLNLAKRRGAYRGLLQATLGEALPWSNAHFAAFLSTGVFTKGHAPASSLDELVRITKPGGHAIFTVRDILLDAAGFRAKFKEIQTAGRWRPIEESPPFRAFVIAEPDVLVKAFVFEIL